MAQTVSVTLTTKGLDTGNFKVTALDNAGTLIAGFEKTAQAFVQNVAISSSDVPDTAYQLKIESVTQYCTNSITLRFKTL